MTDHSITKKGTQVVVMHEDTGELLEYEWSDLFMLANENVTLKPSTESIVDYTLSHDEFEWLSRAGASYEKRDVTCPSWRRSSRPRSQSTQQQTRRAR